MSVAHTEPQTPSIRRIRIGDLTLDTGTRTVHRDAAVVPLPKLSYQLLLTLAEAAPNVVTHDELVARVWPGRVVSPETVTQRVRLLRRALGDDAQQPRYVAAVRGDGYRLLEEAHELPSDASFATNPPRSSRRLIAAALGLTVAIAAGAAWWLGPGKAPPLRSNAIAVLPFESNDVEDDYLAEGLSNQLRQQLGEIPGLFVHARMSSNAFRDAEEPPETIARSLGASLLVNGSMHREDGRIHMLVELIDGASGLQRWSRDYESESDQLKDLPLQIATDVLQQVLPDAELAVVPSARETDNPVAHDLYLLARSYEHEVRDEQVVDVEKLDEAIELYRRSVDADPEFAPAHAGLASALLYRGDVAGAQEPMLRALALDPSSSDVQYTLGLYYWRRGEPGSETAYERAIQLNGSNADALEAYGTWRWHQGEADTPERYFRRAIELDPLSPFRYMNLGNYLGVNARVDEAQAVADTVLRLFPDERGYLVVTRINEVSGRLDEAIAWALKAKQANPDLIDADWQLGELYARIGDFERANAYDPQPAIGQLYFQRRYDELVTLGEELAIEQPDLYGWYLTAFALGITGELEQSVSWYESIGMPNLALTDAREAISTENLSHYVSALAAIGETERARELAQWIVDFMNVHFATGNVIDWWPNTYQACALAVLGDHEGALLRLERIYESPGLVWYPLLKDSLCFRPLQQSPRYLAVVEHVEQRMEALRVRLPETLARHGLDAVFSQL